MKNKVSFRLLAITFGLALSTVLPMSVSADDWPSIRGPHFDGSAAFSDPEMEDRISAGPLRLKVVWKQPIGSGYSGVVKSGEQIVSAMADVSLGQEFVFAMSADSGEMLWKTPTGPVMKGANGSFDGPVATPAVDHSRAYHLSPFGILAAYSLEDGHVVWQHDLTKEFTAQGNFYGFGASPIVQRDVVIIPAGSADGAVMGFNAVDGKVLWKAGSDRASFQSAVAVDIEGKSTIVAAGDTTIFAIEPTTGELLWSRPHGGASGDSAWSLIPVPLPGGAAFLNDHKDGASAIGLRRDHADDVWSGREIRNSYCVPVMSGGVLCSYSSRFLVGVQPDTGERLWRSRSPSNGFLATVADRLVVATLDGTLHVGDVSKTGFDEVAMAKVFDTGIENSDGLLWSLPSVAGNTVYLRSLGAIARVDILPGQDESAVVTDDPETGPNFAAFLKQVHLSHDKSAIIDAYLSDKTTPIIEGDDVHFVLRGDYQDVAVASEFYGVRQERKMKRVADTDLFYLVAKVPQASRLSYVFFADYQPIVDPKNDRTTTSSLLSGEMEPSFAKAAPPLTLSWFDKGEDIGGLPNYFDQPPSHLAGAIVETSIRSDKLDASVDLTIYLPPGYSENVEDYPVVFVHDGEIAIEQGHQTAIVDHLIQTEAIRPAIAVFIHRRFYPMQGANGYAEFFASELLPKIELDYRVSDDRRDRASLGGGFGGTLALMATLPISDQIGILGCQSPFAFEMMHPIFDQLIKLPNERCQALIQWSRYDFRNPKENWNMALQAEVVAKMLENGGHSVTTTVVPTGSDWVSWRTQSEKMWQFLVGQ